MRLCWAPPELRAQYKKCFPSGRNWGQRSLFSARDGSNFVAACGFPPPAETRNRASFVLGVKRMVPSLLQAPPRALTASQSGCGGPPSELIFLSLPAAKKPICRLSGDQKG